MTAITFATKNGILATPCGIYFNEQLLFPIIFERIEKQIFHSESTILNAEADVLFRCKFHTVSQELASQTPVLTESDVFPEGSALTFHGHFNVSMADIPAALQELQRILNPPLKKGSYALCLAALQDIFEFLMDDPRLETVHITDRTGWFHISDCWYYFTATYSIGKDGVLPRWHAECPNGHLLYDETLSARDAVLNLLQILNLDFSATSVIWAQSILGHLRPLRGQCFGFPTPALMLTGRFASFKTQFASRLGRFLTEESGSLDDFPCLQNGSKLLKQKIKGLADTICLIDDLFNTPSQSLKQKMGTVLETSVRDSFSPGSFLVFLFTGEPGALRKMGNSWNSRTIEINFTADEEKKKNRSVILDHLKKSPLLPRTCIFHFLAYLARAIEEGRLSALSAETARVFDRYFPRQKHSDRQSDNLLCLFWAFRVFLRFAVYCNGISEELHTQYEKRFLKVLKNIACQAELNSHVGQPELILEEIFRRLKIHFARVGTQSYHKAPPEYGNPELCCRISSLGLRNYLNTYGHHAIISAVDGYDGVYLENDQYLLGYHGFAPARTLVVVDYEAFSTHYAQIIETERRLNPHLSYGKTPCPFLKELADKGLLLTGNRYDQKNPQYRNLRISNYPFFRNGKLSRERSVLVFQISQELKSSFEVIFKEKKEKEAQRNQNSENITFYEKNCFPEFCDADIQKCASVLQQL